MRTWEAQEEITSGQAGLAQETLTQVINAVMSVCRGMDPWVMVFNLQEKRRQDMPFIIGRTDRKMYTGGNQF